VKNVQTSRAHSTAFLPPLCVSSNSWFFSQLTKPQQFFSQAVMVMRAFAFAGRDVRVLILLGLCYLVVVGLNIYIFCINAAFLPRELYYILPRTGCFPNLGNEAFAIRLGVSLLGLLVNPTDQLTVVNGTLIFYANRGISLTRVPSLRRFSWT